LSLRLSLCLFLRLCLCLNMYLPAGVWGYNTEEERQSAAAVDRIVSIDLETFCSNLEVIHFILHSSFFILLVVSLFPYQRQFRVLDLHGTTFTETG